jgi:hypothetical protein
MAASKLCDRETRPPGCDRVLKLPSINAGGKLGRCHRRQRSLPGQPTTTLLALSSSSSNFPAATRRPASPLRARLMHRNKNQSPDDLDTSECGTYSRRPALRRPSIASFAFDCPPRAINLDIVNAGSTQANARRPLAPRRHFRDGRKRRRDSGRSLQKMD